LRDVKKNLGDIGEDTSKDRPGDERTASKDEDKDKEKRKAGPKRPT
jgi:hypothetical protein